MALYLIDRANRIPTIKSALINSGVLTTVLYETATDLIFTTPRSNKVIRITSTNLMYIGTAWVSGTTLTDVRTLDGGSSTQPDPYDWAIIVTPDVLAFVYKSGTGSSGRCSSIIFTSSVDGTYRFALCFTSDSGAFSNTLSYETTSSNLAFTAIPIAQFGNALLVDGNGFYFTTDMFFKYVTDNKLIPSPAKGIKAVLNGGPYTSQGYYKFGNDVVIQGWYTNNAGSQQQANILIPNGLI